jgi:HEPN domain-containing protein
LLGFNVGRVRVFTRADGYSERDLLHFAYDHLASAKVLFERSPSCHDSAAALSHLGIELLLKALLLLHRDEFPATHDLRRLQRLLVAAAPHLSFTTEGNSVLSRINEFASLRYPEPNGSPEVGNEDLPPILRLVEALAAALPTELRAEFRTSNEKGGRVLMEKYVGPEGAV